MVYAGAHGLDDATAAATTTSTIIFGKHVSKMTNKGIPRPGSSRHPAVTSKDCHHPMIKKSSLINGTRRKYVAI